MARLASGVTFICLSAMCAGSAPALETKKPGPKSIEYRIPATDGNGFALIQIRKDATRIQALRYASGNDGAPILALPNVAPPIVLIKDLMIKREGKRTVMSGTNSVVGAKETPWASIKDSGYLPSRSRKRVEQQARSMLDDLATQARTTEFDWGQRKPKPIEAATPQP